ncbi:glycosyltransferase [Flavivirga sp. 57AJ16]|uniref:glycosyltransferase family 2 protein n=1 Tax=Flavivirga sp. 57AJ16 TaxID=3025307 RepID=UPI00236556B1|nr:glycosyltransferase [Flavivirga sp. 57AJ16]MDD7887613.1 glycosyltransferase [Flavivirga sp. 57AJ16]
MKLSIVIPVYNVEDYISRCIDSLLNQNLNTDDYEIIIVDDGSTDSSIAIAKKYQSKYRNIIIFNQENQGVGAARNKGIDLAKGDYIYFIDPDDYLANNVLKTILNVTKTYNQDILTFQSKATTSSKNNNPSSVIKQFYNIKKVDGISYIANNAFKNEIWWYVINREFLLKSKIRFIEGRWMEDAIFTASLFLKANSMSHIPVDAHRHVEVPNSAMTSKKPKHYLNVIYDNANAAIVYESLIRSVKSDEKEKENCIKRLKTRQQSFVFFMMVRMLKSTIKITEIKKIIERVEKAGAYPLVSFVGEDYSMTSYKVLTKVFNNKYMYYTCFKLFNPILSLKK